MDQESQSRMAALVSRYYKDAEYMQPKNEEAVEASGSEPAELMYNKIDLILYFYLDYMNPHHGMADRRVGLHDAAITAFGDTLLNRMKVDPDMFKNLHSPRSVAESLSQCLDYQLGSNHSTDSAALKVLYTLLLHSISQSDQIFE